MATPPDPDTIKARLRAYSERIDDGDKARHERDTYLHQLFDSGLTQVQLAKLSGITQQRISRIIKTEAAKPVRRLEIDSRNH